MVKKITLLIFLSIIIASCGVSRKAASGSKNISALQNDIIDYSRKYLGKPYRYAGKGPNSFDCSGYTSFVFKKFGHNLSPSSSGQDRQLPSVRRKEELTVGDLVFFEGRSHNGKVGHVGIVTETLPNGNFRFIHASTSNGVIVSSSTEQYYASRYLRGGRVLKDVTLAQSRVKTKQKTTTKSKEQVVKDDKRKNAFITAKAREDAKAEEPQPVDLRKLQPTEKASETASVNDNATDSIAPIIHSRPAETLTDSVQVARQTNYTDSTSLPDSTRKEQQINEQVKNAMIISEPLTVPEPAEVKPGSTQNTPPQILHEVKPGETLYAISRKYGCSVEQLRRWNPNLGKVLKTGEKLIIHTQPQN